MANLVSRLTSQLKGSAKRRGLEWALDKIDVAKLTQAPCAYCGSVGSNRLKYRGEVLRYNGLDRIDNSIGYRLENVLPACRFCNSLRGPMKWETWIGFINQVVSAHGGQPPFPDDGDVHSSKSFFRFQ